MVRGGRGGTRRTATAGKGGSVKQAIWRSANRGIWGICCDLGRGRGAGETPAIPVDGGEGLLFLIHEGARRDAKNCFFCCLNCDFGGFGGWAVICWRRVRARRPRSQWAGGGCGGGRRRFRWAGGGCRTRYFLLLAPARLDLGPIYIYPRNSSQVNPNHTYVRPNVSNINEPKPSTCQHERKKGTYGKTPSTNFYLSPFRVDSITLYMSCPITFQSSRNASISFLYSDGVPLC